MSIQKILANYPTLRAADLVQAWAYVDTHRQEIDEAELAESIAEADRGEVVSAEELFHRLSR